MQTDIYNSLHQLVCIHSKMTPSNAATMRTALRLGDISRFTRCPRCLARRDLRFSSTDSEAPPPLLSKIRNDLKTAMKAKDQSRYDLPLQPKLGFLRSSVLIFLIDSMSCAQ